MNTNLLEVKSTGQVMLCTVGHQTEQNSLVRFHSMHGKAATSEEVCKYPVCCHFCRPVFLCLEIEGRDYLAIGCKECGISLFDLNGKKQTLIKAFPKSGVIAMCEGENNTLYVVDEQFHIVELDCSTTDFKRRRSLYQNIYYFTLHSELSLCYIPFQHRLIILANSFKILHGMLFAISCESSKLLWSVHVPVKEYMRCRYLPEHKGILVYKPFDITFGVPKPSVICPETGVCTQKIPLPSYVLRVEDMLVSKGSLFILRNHVPRFGFCNPGENVISCIVFRVE